MKSLGIAELRFRGFQGLRVMVGGERESLWGLGLVEGLCWKGSGFKASLGLRMYTSELWASGFQCHS